MEIILLLAGVILATTSVWALVLVFQKGGKFYRNWLLLFTSSLTLGLGILVVLLTLLHYISMYI